MAKARIARSTGFGFSSERLFDSGEGNAGSEQFVAENRKTR